MKTISNETWQWAQSIAREYLKETEGYRDLRSLNQQRKARKLLKRLAALKTEGR